MDARTLLEKFSSEPISEIFRVKGLSLHSKQLKAGDLFFAYPGMSHDGRAYIQEALIRRPSGIVLEADGWERFRNPDTDIPFIPVRDLSAKLGEIASLYYEQPSTKMTVIGITGTNGKTTTAHLIYQALNMLGIKAGYLGTLGIAFEGFESSPTLTTPDPISLQKTLKVMCDHGAQVVVMEVSSHALSQHRISGIHFDSAVFTNLTPEHLDYHKNMDNYFQAKHRLFKMPSVKTAIINVDDPYGLNLAQALDPKMSRILYTTKASVQDSHLQKIDHVLSKHYQITPSGIEASLKTPWGEGELRSKLIGKFNLSNLLACLAVLCQQGVAFKEALRVLQKVQPVKGRMECLGGASFPQVVIDFAHTPDALQNSLEAARAICKRRLWVIFGCGGNRDQHKRREMGKIATQFADRIVITNDNPRDESPKAIIQDILMGVELQDNHKVIVEEDRKRAIAYAVRHALSYDVILVAGKGHEAYQIISKQKIPYSDSEWIRSLLGSDSSQSS